MSSSKLLERLAESIENAEALDNPAAAPAGLIGNGAKPEPARPNRRSRRDSGEEWSAA